jgi:hypothetical protein
MRYLLLGFTLTTAVLSLGNVAQARCTDPRVPAVRADIQAHCPCNGNHGQYVSCVARHVRDAVRDGDVDVNCKGAVTKCAARSTCGKKDGFVTCTLCDPGTCDGGFCDDGATACAADSDCPAVVNRCSTKSSAERCEAKGGVVGSGSCCEATCVTGPTTTTAVPPTTTPTPTTSPTPTPTPTTTPPTTTTLGSPSGAFVD